MLDSRASLSLDALRGAAALTVLLHHINWLEMDEGLLSWFRRDIGHSSVVVFFVLSGYLITSSAHRTGSLLDYGINRAARVYSVAVPAVLLSYGVSLGLNGMGIVTPASYELLKPWLYGLVALSFIGDLWWLAVPTFDNGVFWSLGYEVWYYAVFGVAMFLPGWWRWIAASAVLAVMGPRLWLLFPLWLGGAGIVLAQSRWRLARNPARGLATAALVVLVAMKVFHWDEAWPSPTVLFGIPLRFSQWFLADYLVGIVTVVLVYAIVFAELPIGGRLARPIRFVANVSFGVYVVHFALLMLFKALLPATPLLGAAAAAACSVLFALVFEPLRRPLRHILQRSAPRLGPSPG